MTIERIVAGTDGSDTSGLGVRTALAWGDRLGAHVSFYHVAARRPQPELAAASRSAGPEHVSGADLLETGFGLPEIELPRFAERVGAGLLVLGRKPPPLEPRFRPGKTADAVARRSTVPCLFVSGPLEVPERLLVALDGSERGLRVLRFALDIAMRLGARLSGVIVEPADGGGAAGLAAPVPSARTAVLQGRLDGAVQPLIVSHGNPELEILRAAEDVGADVIILGCRRGSHPDPTDQGSVGRRVVQAAPCAVLTVPL
jgi:nucleotide-binding universal stress UspA family protein